MDTRLTALRKEKALETTIRKEIEALRRMTVGQLRQKYAGGVRRGVPVEPQAVPVPAHRLADPGAGRGRPLGTRAPPRAGDRQRRRPAHPGAEDDVPAGRQPVDPQAARDRSAWPPMPTRGCRRPAPYLEREYKGRRHHREGPRDGFEYEGQIYRSLSAIAREVTGTKWNGFLFFGCAADNGGTNEKR